MGFPRPWEHGIWTQGSRTVSDLFHDSLGLSERTKCYTPLFPQQPSTFCLASILQVLSYSVLPSVFSKVCWPPRAAHPLSTIAKGQLSCFSFDLDEGKSYCLHTPSP